MATVEEMVKEWRAARNGPAIQSALLTALQDLGIWDAEVLEGVLEPRDWQNDGRAHDVAIFTTDPAPADLCERAEAAERVRVIVLKEEE